MADTEPRECVIFTSISGLKVEEALQKLVRFADVERAHSPIDIVKLEAGLIPTHLANFPGESPARIMARDGGLQYLLLRPEPYLRCLWRDSVHKELARIPTTDHDLFILMHTVMYNTSSRVFFSPIDPRILADWAARNNIRIRAVVSLIEDVYDIFRWLSQPGQLFDSPRPAGEQQRFEPTTENIDNLLICLNWRASGLLYANSLVDTLNTRRVGQAIPHLTLAVKQHTSVFYDAVFSDKLLVYLSHPITEPRKLLRQGQRDSYERFTKQVQLLTAMVARSDKLIPVAPASIDELILDSEDVNEKGALVPRLLPRWPSLDASVTLHVPPPVSTVDILDPYQWLNSDEREEFVAEMRPLLQALHQQISMQVGSRDRALVEQAAGLIVWRPYFNGRPADGVLREIRYRNDLRKYLRRYASECQTEKYVAQRDSRCFVYNPGQDLGRYRVEVLLDRLRSNLIALNSRRSLSEDELSGLRKRLCALTNQLSLGQLTGRELQTAANPHNEYAFKPSQGYDGPLAGSHGPSERVETAIRWQSLANEVNHADVLARFLEPGDLVFNGHGVSEEFLPSQFVQWVQENLQ